MAFFGVTEVVQEGRGGHRAMDRDPAETAPEVQMQRRQVAEAHEELAVWTEPLRIEKGHDPRRSVPAAQRHDRGDGPVLEVAHQLSGPRRIVSGQVAPRLEDALIVPHPEPEALQPGSPGLDAGPVRDGARRRDDANRVSRAERAGQDPVR